MRFIRIIPKNLLNFEIYVDYSENHYVFLDNDNLHKIAVKLSDEIYALYEFSEYQKLDKEHKKKVIQECEQNSMLLFKESVGVFSSNANGILYDLATIIKVNATSEDCFFYKSVNDSVISLKYNTSNNIFGIFLFDKLIFKLSNEASANQAYQLLKKDIKNYLKYRFNLNL